MIFTASREQTHIKSQDISEKLKKIVMYVNDAQSFLNTFGKNVVEIFNNELLTENALKRNKEKYQAEYYIGISARPEHIKANVDIVREEKLEIIEDHFQGKNIVIIHGASGQGKSSLSYRYLFNCQPFSYEIRDYNSTNLLDILSTLKQLSQTLGQQIPIYIDVQKSDPEWLKIAQELFRYPEHFKLLVSIREEDWNATNQDTFSFIFSDIELTFDKNEAEGIFKKFEKFKKIKGYPTFEDAWFAYGEKGPLLEFVYLLTQGQTLEKRLKSQIRNPKYSSQHKKLLRLISFTGQYEASIKTRALYEISGLEDDILFDDIITFFENEHLIRRIDANQIITLHPIRAALLTEILMTEITPLQEIAVNCLDIINERDFEIFLKYYFLEYPTENESVVEYLYNREYKNWATAAGVLRALLWLGIYQYVEANKHLIKEAFEKNGIGWYLMAPVDLLKLRNDLSGNIEQLFKESPNYDFYTEILNKYTDTSAAIEYGKTFCIKMNAASMLPVDSNFDLKSFSELLFWWGYFRIDKVIDFKNQLNFDVLMKLGPRTLSYLFLGLYEYSQDVFNEFKEIREQVVNRFKLEYDIPCIEEKDGEVKMHCLVSENTDIPEGESNDGHWTVITRLSIARRLFPEKEYYATKGYGFNPGYLNIDFNSTKKRVPQKNLPMEWYTTINQYFIGLGTFKFRPNSWEEYFGNIFDYMRKVEKFLDFLTGTLESLTAKEKQLDNVFFDKYNKLRPRNRNELIFQKNIVDKFGKISEIQDFKNKEIEEYRISYAIKKHLPLKDALSKFTFHFDNFANQASELFVFKAVYSNQRGDRFMNRVNLSLSNLQDAIRNFDKLLGILKTSYSKFLENASIISFEKFYYLFGLYEAFIKDKKCKGPEEVRIKIEKLKNFQNPLFEKVGRLKNKGIDVDIRCIERDWFFIADTEDIIKYANTFEILVKKLRGIIGHHERISLKRTVLESFINDLYIVPLFKKKLLLENLKFKLDLFSLFDQDTLKRNPLFNVAHKLDINYIRDTFRLSRWAEKYPELGCFQACSERLTVLRHYVNYFSEVAELCAKLDDEDIGIEIIKSKLEEASKSGIQVQPILDDFTKGVNLINEKLDTLNDDGKSVIYNMGLKPLEYVFNEFLPVKYDENERKKSFSINISQFPDWAKKLNAGFESTVEKYFTAIGVVISVYENG
jgi:hypothetical protein